MDRLKFQNDTKTDANISREPNRATPHQGIAKETWRDRRGCGVTRQTFSAWTNGRIRFQPDRLTWHREVLDKLAITLHLSEQKVSEILAAARLDSEQGAPAVRESLGSYHAHATAPILLHAIRSPTTPEEQKDAAIAQILEWLDPGA